MKKFNNLSNISLNKINNKPAKLYGKSYYLDILIRRMEEVRQNRKENVKVRQIERSLLLGNGNRRESGAKIHMIYK